MSSFLPKTVLFSAAAGALLLAACQKQVVTPDPGNEPKLRPLTGAENKTVASSNEFAFRSFGALRAGAPDDNLCMSPLSVSAALTMAYNGADGTTKAAMKQTLGFAPQTDTEINESFQGLFGLLTGIDNKVTFAAANSIWHGQQYQLAPAFTQKNQTYFGATVQGVNFTQPSAKDAINGWVAAKTQGKIPTIVQETKPEDVMYLVNAIYFKGAWTYRFDPALTRQAPFTRENGGPVNVNFMTLKTGKYRRYQDAQQEVIDLPYGNRQFSMTLVVPRGNSTLAAVGSRLTGPQLATWLQAADTTGLELHLPKFKLEYEREMDDILTQLGMGVAFGDQANFSQMLANSSNNLSISSVKHKTYIDVNEEGTEAAAATSVGIINTSLPPSIRIDRPFYFLIREKSSNAILFIGQLTNP